MRVGENRNFGEIEYISSKFARIKKKLYISINFEEEKKRCVDGREKMDFKKKNCLGMTIFK